MSEHGDGEFLRQQVRWTTEEGLPATGRRLGRIADELERLETIVEQLPKDADGVPVADSTRLYFVHPELDEIWDWRLKIRATPHIVAHVGDDDECSVLLPEDGHVSREAAEAELKQRKGKG